MIFELCDAVVVEEDANNYLFVLEKYKIKVKKTKATIDFVDELVRDRFINSAIVQDENIKRVIEKLKQRHILLPPLEPIQNINFNNLKFLSYVIDNPTEVQSTLEKKHICIIGLGGVGQVVLQHLVASGFRKFTVIDFDVVQATNFNRQFMLNKSQIGQDKLDSVENYINNWYDNVVVKKIHKMIMSESDLDSILSCYNFDMLICAADQPQNGVIKKIVTKASIKYNVPCAFGSIGINIGEIGPILTTKEAKESFLIVLEDKSKTKFSKILGGSICFTNSLVSIVLAHNIYKFFIGLEGNMIINKIVLLDCNSLETAVISLM